MPVEVVEECWVDVAVDAVVHRGEGCREEEALEWSAQSPQRTRNTLSSSTIKVTVIISKTSSEHKAHRSNIL